MSARIYLDHNATTPLHPGVVEAMIPVLREGHGNPSSTHAEGAAARRLVDRARDQVAECLSVNASEIVFTGGATEANNTVLLGLDDVPGKIVTTDAEHPSVVAPLELLEDRGCEVVRLRVGEDGMIDLADLDAALATPTRLVSIIWANNETGVIQPVEEIAQRVKAAGVLLHVDATQAVGKAPVDLSRVPVDFLSCSAHKFNGPKGVGCLVVRDGAACAPLLLGGPQERRFRGGTENVASIVGIGVAAELAREDLDARIEGYGALRDRLWDHIREKIPDLRRNGDTHSVLCNTLNVEFLGVAGDVLLQALDLEGVAVSAGAACHSGSISPSHVLTAMGRTPEQALASLRLSVGLGVDAAQIDRAAGILDIQVAKVRAAGG
ncbi:MAG: cysteine desulfurase [Deltaproteobacteria bacterium]|nr:cysteine desulfurase [Deltaproteobacteria bacterium]MBW2723787.1 cysteine desulfurase [Deltaproteobacteria bacterium]